MTDTERVKILRAALVEIEGYRGSLLVGIEMSGIAMRALAATEDTPPGNGPTIQELAKRWRDAGSPTPPTGEEPDASTKPAWFGCNVCGKGRCQCARPKPTEDRNDRLTKLAAEWELDFPPGKETPKKDPNTPEISREGKDAAKCEDDEPRCIWKEDAQEPGDCTHCGNGFDSDIHKRPSELKEE